MKVLLEVGQKKVFAVALDWIGLARSGRTEQDALQSLLDYVPRYRRSMGSAAADLATPANVGAVEIIRRLEGDATTDFGAPGAIAPEDREPLEGSDLEAVLRSLRAAWRAFEASCEVAQGRTLEPSGPRGGGRTLERMRVHVREADEGYTSAVGGRAPAGDASQNQVQERFIDAIRARAAGELPDVGPRGGKRWPARFAVRRSAWHSLDHAWELEDRASDGRDPAATRGSDRFARSSGRRPAAEEN